MHLVRAVRGGGGGESDSKHLKRRAKTETEMNLAAGGEIKQYIQTDPHSPDVWNTEKTTVFNVQIVNAAAYQSVTGMPPPPCPVDEATYKAQGLPFFDIPEETSSISGDFAAVESHDLAELKSQLDLWLHSNPQVKLDPQGPLALRLKNPQ